MVTSTKPLGQAAVSAIIPACRRPSPRTPGLPVAGLMSPERHQSNHYAVTAMDVHGRLADRSAVRMLGWAPLQPIAMTITLGGVFVLRHSDGSEAITRQGHLRLPAAVRYSVGLKAGDRVLLVAFAEHDALVAYTIPALDTMILTYHRFHLARTQP